MPAAYGVIKLKVQSHEIKNIIYLNHHPSL